MATRNLAELAEIGFKGYTPVTAGPYKTEITNVTPKVSSNKNPMVIVEYSIADGPYKGKKVKDQMTFAAESEGSLGVFFGKMRNLGLTKEWWDQLPAFEGIIDAVPYVAQALIGRPAYIQVSVNEYQGRLNNKVDKVLSAQEIQATFSAQPVTATAIPGVPVVAGVPGVPSLAPSVSNEPVTQQDLGVPAVAAPVAPPVPGVPTLPPGL
jgi:hypothetical protein